MRRTALIVAGEVWPECATLRRSSNQGSKRIPSAAKPAIVFRRGFLRTLLLRIYYLRTSQLNRYSEESMPKPQHRDLFPGALEMMILQTLHRKPTHGYALAQQIKQVSDDLLQIEE